MRKKLFHKQGYKHLQELCFFCGEDDYSSLQCHRIIAGGIYNQQNVLTVCASCHCKIHSGKIKIDRKYDQMPSPFYKVHYWIDEEEFWKDEIIKLCATDAGNYHSGLGSSRKMSGKRRKAQGTTSDNQAESGQSSGGCKSVCNDSSREEK